MNTESDVIIIGSGIAGTVAAVALHKAGIPGRVFEARPSAVDTEGAFLTLAVNGIEALAAVDLDASTFGGFDTPRFTMSLGDGTKLAEMPNGPLRPNAVSQTIKRADLCRGLRHAAEARGVPIEYGKKLSSITPDGEGVIAHFTDGESAKGRCLIAADGLHSRVRSMLDPNVSAPRYLGLLNAGGFAEGVSVPGDPGTMHFVFGKRCFLGWVKHPDGSVWWFANPGRAKEPSREELDAIDWHAHLTELFADDVSPGASLVAATASIATGFLTYDLPKVPRWHDDRTILIGDAAHAASPSSGQGASMAIEDAIVLAKCLRDEQTTASAFAAYEAKRRTRVERMVAYGKRNGTGKTPGAFGRVLRDLFLKMLFRKRTLGDPMAWIYEERIAWA